MSQTTPDRFDPLTVPLSPGITLVEASAGTGKTFAITRLVLRLLLEGDRPLALREIAQNYRARRDRRIEPLRR